MKEHNLTLTQDELDWLYKVLTYIEKEKLEDSFDKDINKSYEMFCNIRDKVYTEIYNE